MTLLVRWEKIRVVVAGSVERMRGDGLTGGWFEGVGDVWLQRWFGGCYCCCC